MEQNSTMLEYERFLESKRHISQNFGIEPLWIPDTMKPYQAYTADRLIRKGRGAGYLDTGMGKTFIELVIAANYLRAHNKRVLILTPIAVAFQFLKEAEKFGIDDVSHFRKGELQSKIVVCNYERIHLLNESDFDCIICDESSAIKDADGKTRSQVTAFMKKIRYRFLFTATPAPNDYTELGTSSEALGYLGYTDMLTKFFKNNEDTISPMNIGTEWRLKGHAEKAFFEWVSTWAIAARRPSDLGFDDDDFVLPELKVNYNWVKNEKPLVIKGQYQMFNIVARTNSEMLAERRATIENRCEKSVELASGHDVSVYWCNLNPEGDLIAQLDKTSVQLTGKMKLEAKEEILLSFLDGGVKKLITKPTISAWGLNWQHCGHATVFPNFSYEQWYQLIRRFWRFGRTEPVTIDAVLSDGQKRVLDAILAKTKKADTQFSMLKENVNLEYKVQQNNFDKKIQHPSFL